MLCINPFSQYIYYTQVVVFTLIQQLTFSVCLGGIKLSIFLLFLNTSCHTFERYDPTSLALIIEWAQNLSSAFVLVNWQTARLIEKGSVSFLNSVHSQASPRMWHAK